MGTDVADPSAFLSPIDNDLVSLAIAAQLVLFYVHSNRYIDPGESLAAELQRMAQNIGAVVPIRRVKSSAQSTSDWGLAIRMPIDLQAWAIRRGDLRTALQRLAVQAHERPLSR